jgi:Flp pilus assembly protein TadG
MTQHHAKSVRRRPLARLLRDTAGNTLVIMAAAMIPLSALAGSGVDMARLYVVKSRLQQACDAGVLAGRKYMATSTSPTLDATATTRAKTFFANNFQKGWLDTGTPDFRPVKTSDQQVSGTARVTVPMTVMKMFATPDVQVAVACKARFDVADTDIIFVLDTTGSMACRPEDSESACSSYVNGAGAPAYTRPTTDPDAVPGYLGSTGYGVVETTSSSGSRIKALRAAVKNFYATINANVDSNTRIRYGFVTYTSTVNAGRAIQQMNPAFLIGGGANEKVAYETRYVEDEWTVSTTNVAQNNNKSQTGCVSSAKNPVRDPVATTDVPRPFKSDSTATYKWQEWNGTKCADYTRLVRPVWRYIQYEWPVSNFVAGKTLVNPTRFDGATTRWDGCVEERQTEAGKTSFSSASFDLDPDLLPTSAAATRWKPMWADVSYARKKWTDSLSAKVNDEGNTDRDHPMLGSVDQRDSGFYSCGKPVHRLSTMTAAQIAAYVDAVDFKPLGGTYHDTGMIWGTRMLSPNGIFAADNVGRPGQGTPKRVIVFLTDGDMAPNRNLYGLYGMEFYDKRVSGTSTPSAATLKGFHNARFLYECDRARQLGIDVWTVAIGLESTTELKKCAATEEQALWTTSGSGLSVLFETIAKQVAMLRIVK